MEAGEQMRRRRDRKGWGRGLWETSLIGTCEMWLLSHHRKPRWPWVLFYCIQPLWQWTGDGREMRCWAWGSLIRACFQPDVHHGLHWCAVTETLPSAAGLHTSSFTCSSALHLSSFSNGSSRWDKRCHRRGAGVMEAAWNWKYVEMNRTFRQLFRIPRVIIINRWALQE